MTLNPNNLVAMNLQAARKYRGWTQKQALAHLAEFGVTWSIASLSDAERSWNPARSRNREFDATQLVAFSLAYEMPISYWFLPPPDERRDMIDDADLLLELLFDSSPEVEDRLLAQGANVQFTPKNQKKLRTIRRQLETLLVTIRSAQEDLAR